MRVVEAIYLGFGFFKKISEFLIAAPIKSAMANIGNIIIYKTLSIDGRLKN